ncbi:hypothetical protein O9929_25270 [Vibrio lentus]|nr:hypothetical protein [Vibrio lentus]
MWIGAAIGTTVSRFFQTIALPVWQENVISAPIPDVKNGGEMRY